MDNRLQVLAAQELYRRSKIKTLLSGLFESQKDVATGILSRKERRAAVVTSRRAGKSWLIISLLLFIALTKPRSHCVYFALTNKQARRIAFNGLVERLHDLGIKVRTNSLEMTLTLPNGSIIECSGADGPSDQLERWLGTPLDLACVDEAGSFSDTTLKYLVSTVLWPSLIDRKGALLLCGTPRPIRNLFWRACECQEPGWAQYRWGTDVNPYMRSAWLEELEELKGLNPHIEREPFYRREYLGEFVFDNESRIYRIGDQHLLTSWQPKPEDQYYLAVDWGFTTSATAMVLGVVNPKHYPYLVYLNAEEHYELRLDGVVSRLKEYMNNYNNIRIIADSGGASRALVDELRITHSIPIKAATKTDKEAQIELWNKDAALGLIKIFNLDKHAAPYESKIYKQFQSLMWLEQKNGTFKEGRPRDIADSCLYMRREASSLMRTYKKPEEVITSDPQGDAMFDEVMKSTKKKGRLYRR